MKKIFLSIAVISLSIMTFAQGTISFYTNNGTKKVTQIKCGEFDNIKVKLKVPSYVNKFDMVKLIAYFSGNPSTAQIIYNGKGSISQLTSNPNLEKWILKPGKKDGDFYFSSTGINDYDLCGYPREMGKASLLIDVELTGYNKTGTKKYWDEYYKEYRIKTLYTKGTVVSRGQLKIIQQDAQSGYISKNGVVSIQKVTADPSHEGIKGDNSSSPMSRFNFDSKGKMFEIFSATQLKLSKKGFAQFNVLFFSDDKVKEKVQKLFGQVPDDLDPYAELKRDMLQLFISNAYPSIYRKPFFDWPESISKTFCPYMQDEKKKLKNSNNFFTNVSLWQKQKIGEYEFDVLKIPNAYGEDAGFKFNSSTGKFNSNDVVAGNVIVYAIRRGNYSIFIFPTYDDNNYNNVFAKSSNPNTAKSQTEFITKTFGTLKFLK